MYLNSKTICHFRHLSMYISQVIVWDDEHSVAVSVQLPSHVWLFGLCDCMNYSTLGLPVHHQLPKSTQTHVHWVCHVIQPSHPLSSPSPPTLNLSQHQGLFKWVSSSHQVAKVLEFQLQHQSFQWTSRADLLYDGLVGVGSREELSQVQGKEQCCALLEQPWRDTPHPR